jgi:hypothetical protein
MPGAAELSAGVPNSIPPLDAAINHPWTFAFMIVLMLMFGIGRVAKLKPRWDGNYFCIFG